MKKIMIGAAAAAVMMSTAAAVLPDPAGDMLISAEAADIISGTASQNFTADGTASNYFEITGNLSSGKGTAVYNGMTLTQCLKMESTTSVKFTTAGTAKVTLVIQDGQTVYVDSQKLDITGSPLTVSVGAGAHEIKKGSGSSNLFYISVEGDGSAVVTTAPPVQTTEPVATTAAGQPAVTTAVNPPVVSGALKAVTSGGWNEMLFAVFSGIQDADVTAVSYSGAANGTLQGQDLQYLVRDTQQGVRIDIPGLKAGTYQLHVETTKGAADISGISVSAQDRSGYAHFKYTDGVGAYRDDGTLKANAVVLYVTDSNKNTVTVQSKDGTKVTGIGNILNSTGQDVGGGKTSKGGKANTNQDIIEKLAKDGTPLVIRLIGDVKAPDGLTAYDSVDYGGSVGDNGYMARMQSGKDVTIEGIGSDAAMNGWGIHFIAESANPTLGKSFEVRNLKFRNVPEDCIGMEGVQEGSKLTASVERCWIHNNEFYKPSISNPAESDKAGGDGACDFKRGMYFTNSYNYYEGYHKTNLVGASDSNLQFHLTYHHNYWYQCESRGPLARQANIHMYNNVFEGQTGYCQNPRANAYIFSEYNLFENCKNPQQVKLGAIKSYHDTLTGCKGDMDAVTVTDKSQKVSSGNTYGDFDTNASLSYIPTGDYVLETDTAKLKTVFQAWGGTLDDSSVSGTQIAAQPVTTPAATTATTVTTTTTTVTTVTTTVSEPQNDGVTGDVNGDTEVDVADAVLLARFLAEDAEAIISEQGFLNADADHSGVTDTEDVIMILRYIAKLIDTL